MVNARYQYYEACYGSLLTIGDDTKMTENCIISCGEGIGGKQFIAIMNHFVVILGSFFGDFWGHFLDHFLEYVNNQSF